MSELSFHNQLRALRYVGSKIRLMPKLRPLFAETGAKVLVDVFGGSGAVTMGSGFDKRVFNDVDGDVVNFYRVLGHPVLSKELFHKLRRMPMSREVFDDLNREYVAWGKTFKGYEAVERAAAFFYRSAFAFGGKVRNGGFGATVSDRVGCKEIKRAKNILRRLPELRDFWMETVIEQQDFAEIIASYGNREGVLLFCDPPYFGTEKYYSRDFPMTDHSRLAAVLKETTCAVVITYYDTREIRALYPEGEWEHRRMESTKNSMKSSDNKQKVRELVLVRQAKVRPEAVARQENGELALWGGGECRVGSDQ